MCQRRYNTTEHSLRRIARMLNLLSAVLMLGTGWYIWFAYDALISTATALVILIGCSLFFAGTIAAQQKQTIRWLVIHRLLRSNVRRGIYRLTWPGRRAFLWFLLILEQRT